MWHLVPTVTRRIITKHILKKEDNMRNIKTITEEYRKGNFEKRLNLFLECPLLRDEFMQIEQDEASAQSAHLSQSAANQTRRKKFIFYPCTRLLKRCQSLIS